MKRTKILLAALAIMAIGTVNAQLNAGVTTAPVPSAILQATSTSQGFLPPVMNKVQMNAIASPAAGLIVYCTDCSPVSPWYYNGTTWVPMASASNNPPTTFGCSSATQTQSPAGSLVQNTVYSGSYSIPYTAGNGSSYAASTQTVNGLTLTRPAGTLSGSGSVVYTLTGTYTGATNGTVSFTIPECSTTAVFGDAIRAGLSAGGCASCTAYDAAGTNTWVNVTAAEYTAVQTSVSGTGKYGASDAVMSTAPSTSWSNSYTVTLTTIQTQVPAANYPFAMTVLSGTGGTVTNTSGFELKLSPTSITSGYANYPVGASLPSLATTISTQYYFVIKRPTAPTTAASYIAEYNSSTFNVSIISGGNTQYYSSGDVSNPSTSFTTGSMLLQLLSTPTKQW